MSGSNAWAQAFKISPDTLQSWSRNLRSGESLLVHAIDNGHVHPEAYITWARDHYGLASLGDPFFSQPVNHELWNQIKSVGSWSEHMIPIRFWDNVIFVLVSEPPSEIQWSFPVQYLLADPRSMKRYWQSLHAAPTTAPQPAVSAPPAPPSPMVTEPNPPPMVTEPNPPPMVTEPAPPPPSATEAPLGLSLNIPLGNAEAHKSDAIPEGLSSGLAANLGSDVPPPQPDAESEAPVGLSLSPQITLSLHLDSPVGLAASPAPESAPMAPTSPAAPVLTSTETPTPATPISTPPPKSGPVSHAVQVAAPADISMAQSDEEALAWTFAQLGPHYERSIALIFDGKLLRLWKHDGRWNPTSGTAESQAVDSEKPSLFRILRRTSLPYHGRVADSPSHQEFFAAWNQGQIPPHATAVPLKMAGQLIGMILSVGGETANSERCLKIAEEATFKLGEQLDKVGLKAA